MNELRVIDPHLIRQERRSFGQPGIAGTRLEKACVSPVI